MMFDRRQALAAFAATALAPPVAAASDMGARIDALVSEKLAGEHVPGAAFVAVRNGEVVHASVFGVRERERNLPVTLDTLFPIGSATKPFTSMAAGLMQDRGLLRLDDHPRRHLPWFRLRDEEADARVTIRDMLSHATGLRAYADLAAEPGVLSREEYVRATMSARPEYPFRSRFQYSNGMITAVGLILGAIHGGSWEEMIAAEVLRPLGMQRSLATFEDLPGQADHATGYVYDPAAADWRATPPPRSLVAMAPAGSICASAREAALWLQALTRGGAPLVSRATFAQLTEPRMAISDQLAYALCWAVYGWNGMKVVEHNGGSQGICALVSFIPEAGTGFAFLGNTSPNFLTRIASLGPLIYPQLLGVAAPSEAPVASARPAIQSPPPTEAVERPAPALPDLSLAEVLERIAAAPGGGDRHRTLLASGVRAYESQGITAPLTIRAAAPASREEVETWRAAGREIGRLRIWFDGDKGGQETTFGQDTVFEGAAAEMRRDSDFRPWTQIQTLYPQVSVAGTGWVGDRPVLHLALRTEDSDQGRLSVGLDDWLIVEREKGGARTVYSDYRPVDGERIAHRWETHDALGLTSVQLYEAAFDAAVPASAFKAA